jgi:hypothetical protein
MDLNSPKPANRGYCVVSPSIEEVIQIGQDQIGLTGCQARSQPSSACEALRQRWQWSDHLTGRLRPTPERPPPLPPLRRSLLSLRQAGGEQTHSAHRARS